MATFRYADIEEGAVHTHDYAITAAHHEALVQAFGDASPIHVDSGHARGRGFADRVMHGAILNGFVSHFVGMVLPGSTALLLSVELRYTQPSYLGDRLRLRAKVVQKLDSHRIIVLHLSFENVSRGGVSATGRAQVKIEHE